MFGSSDVVFNFDVEKLVLRNEGKESARLVKNGNGKYKNTVFIALESTRPDVLNIYGAQKIFSLLI